MERRKSIPKMTIGKLSMLTGLSASVLSRYETGKRRPGPEALARLAPHLKATHHYLLYLAGHISKEDWEKVRARPDEMKVFVKEEGTPYISDLDYISREEETLIARFRALKANKLKNGFMKLLEGILEMKNNINDKAQMTNFK
ncbi:MAG: helix-turn-helix domain-containing protein [Nitrospinae bacterium]|nr:helix-turn-helix domain-containing protein [Nitrospinota bacterium]